MLQNVVRLAQYGLHYISGGGGDLDYCVYSSMHLPPELFLKTELKDGQMCRSGDIWALGIVLLELSIVGFPFQVPKEVTDVSLL